VIVEPAGRAVTLLAEKNHRPDSGRIRYIHIDDVGIACRVGHADGAGDIVHREGDDDAVSCRHTVSGYRYRALSDLRRSACVPRRRWLRRRAEVLDEGNRRLRGGFSAHHRPRRKAAKGQQQPRGQHSESRARQATRS
jgi:hypothetical protein